MSKSIYGELSPYRKLGKESVDKRDLRPLFYEFFDKFKEHLAEYTRESLVETQISEVVVEDTPGVIFEDIKGVRVTLQNQGNTVCFLTTDGKGKFRLAPEQRESFWVNRSIIATTMSGSTTLGFIRC